MYILNLVKRARAHSNDKLIKKGLFSGVLFFSLMLLSFTVFMGLKDFVEKEHLPVSSNSAIGERGYAYWSGMIGDQGGEAAYTVFKNHYTPDIHRPSEAHSAAHNFGAALYAHEELGGVVVCDSAFVFGCYHGFVVQALLAEGVAVLPLLDEECAGMGITEVELFSCQHGLGHGIVSYYGLDFLGLKKGLEICETLSSTDPLSGCKSGAFMEYNFRSVLSVNEDATIRPLENEKFLYPCTELPVSSQEACYFAQPSWWGAVLRGDYVKMGQLCDSVEDSLLQRRCYEGVGAAAVAHANLDVRRVGILCEQMPSAQGVSFCKIRAAWSFYRSEDPEAYTYGAQLCRQVDSRMQYLCNLDP